MLGAGCWVCTGLSLGMFLGECLSEGLPTQCELSQLQGSLGLPAPPDDTSILILPGSSSCLVSVGILASLLMISPSPPILALIVFFQNVNRDLF